MVLGFAGCAILAFVLTMLTIRTSSEPVVGAPAE
jgi:DHA1 family bicyclomycin/chloramphenicol resistance-like MFS transporter